MNNNVVTIQLDRVRELRLGHRAMKRWSAHTGQRIEQLDVTKMGAQEAEELMYFMLEKDAETHGETLTLSQMEDLLDTTDLGTLYDALGRALTAAFPEADDEKNVERAAVGTGKSG